jgi:type IV secretion system protein VirD4
MSTNYSQKNQRGFRILAKGEVISNDTWDTQLNNNDMVIGPSGAGKTRGYVAPLIVTTEESIIVSDTKGNLYNKYKDSLLQRGFRVKMLDLVNCSGQSVVYNPLDYVYYDRDERRYSEVDIRKIANLICPTSSQEREPFWCDSARLVIESLIAYVLEATPAYQHHFGTVLKLFENWDKQKYDRLFKELKLIDPDSYAVKKYMMYKNLFDVYTTCACVKQFAAQALNGFTGKEIGRVLHSRSDFKLKEIGSVKTAFFINVSDTDRSQDRIVNLFYSQAIQQLINAADKNQDCKLKVPTRIVFDDFAAGTYIPDFDQIISVIRSREISVSIILQSLSQLEGLYGHSKAMTIVNCCDHMIYLGGTDVETADYIARKMNIRPHNVLNMGLDFCCLFERGNPNGPKIVEKTCIDEILKELERNNNEKNKGTCKKQL